MNRKAVCCIGLVLSFVCFLQAASGYVVVLKSGKKVEGALLSEDERSVRMKDAGGKLLLFLRSEIDFEATASANAGSQTSPAGQPEKTFTNEDMRRLYGAVPQTRPAQTQPEEDASAPEVDDSGWLNETQRKAAEYAEQLRELMHRRAKAMADCKVIYGMYDDHGLPVEESKRILTPQACKDIDELGTKIEDLKEKARVDGVPLQWLENQDL